MKRKITISQAVSEFRGKAAPLVAVNDLAGLKTLFARFTADARVANKEDHWAAQEAMREALREVLLEPSRRVKTGWFSDL
jgi:hypothetical protein